MAGKRITDLAAAEPLVGDELIEVSQRSDTVTITAVTISAQASDNSFNDSGAGFVAAGFAVGNRVGVEGFTGNVANNLLVGVITALTAGKMTIGGTDGDVIVDDAAGESVTIFQWVSRRATAQEIADLAPGGGGGSPLEIEDEGVSEDAAVVKINFTGAGVTATQTAPGEVDVDIPGGGGGGTSLENTMLPPETADFAVSRYGTGGAATDFALGVSLAATISATNTNDLTYLANAIPSPGAAGWKVTARFRRHTPWATGLSMGLMIRDSVGGRSRLFWPGIDGSTGIIANQFTNDTTWNNVSGVAANWFDNNLWMELEDDLTNRILRISADGYHWQRVLVESRTAWVTPNQVGFFLNPNGFAASANMQGSAGRFSCLSWEVVTLP